MTSQRLSPGASLHKGKYTIKKVLGQGGFGITYLASLKTVINGELGGMTVDVNVAIKEFFIKDICQRSEDTLTICFGEDSRAMMSRFKQKFVKEALGLSSMNHPGIVKVTDIFEENNTVYFVMEHISGGSLSEYVKAQPNHRLSDAIAIKLTRQIGDALEYMHTRHMCHLDVKPANILLNESGQVVLIDFGLSKNYDEDGNQTSTTPTGVSHGYAPLEQYQQAIKEFSPTTDVYSLGATLFFMLTGTTPPDAMEVNENGLTRPEGINPAIFNAIERAMSPLRRSRPQNVAEFLTLLPETDEEPATVIIPPTPPVIEVPAHESPIVVEPELIEEQIEEPAEEPIEEPIGEPKTKSSKKKLLIIMALLLIIAAAIIGVTIYNSSAQNGNDEIENEIEDNSDEAITADSVDIPDKAYQTPETTMPTQSAVAGPTNAEPTKEDQSKDRGTDVKVESVPEIMPEKPTPVVNNPKPSKITEEVITNPQFKGGNTALYEYLSANLKYPASAVQAGHQGSVKVKFYVETNGTVSEATIISDTTNDVALKIEALRIVTSTSGMWQSGTRNGVKIRISYTLPINFNLN